MNGDTSSNLLNNSYTSSFSALPSTHSRPSTVEDAKSRIQSLQAKLAQSEKRLQQVHRDGNGGGDIELRVNPAHRYTGEGYANFTDEDGSANGNGNGATHAPSGPKPAWRRACEVACGGDELDNFDTYFATPFHKIIAKRLPWLIGLLLLQSFNAFILGSFEDILSDHITLTFFVSMLAGSAGNSGNQPSQFIYHIFFSSFLGTFWLFVCFCFLILFQISLFP